MQKNRSAGAKLMGLVIIIVTGFLIFKNGVLKAETAKNKDLRILKNAVTSRAKFYPYTADGVKMEVVAVKASDGTTGRHLTLARYVMIPDGAIMSREAMNWSAKTAATVFRSTRLSGLKTAAIRCPLPRILK